MENFFYRKAVKEDLPYLVEFLAKLFMLEQDYTIDSGKQKMALELILKREDQAVIYVVLFNDIPCGMVSGQIVISTATGAPAVWVEDLYIHENYRNKGLGTKILEHLQEWALEKGAGRIQLLVDEHNLAAQEFYNLRKFSRSNMRAYYKYSAP